MIKKTTTLFLLFALLPLIAIAQLITSQPGFVTEKGSIEIIFDATQGNKGLVGATECYVHTGVITNLSLSGSDWKYAPTWCDNAPKYKLTSLGNDKWKFIITPDIRTFYGVATNERILQLAFVFRDATGSKVGKTTGEGDIFVNIYQDGLHVEFTSPTNNTLVSPTSDVTTTINASQSAVISLYLNTTDTAPIKTIPNAVTLSHTQRYTKGNYYLIAKAEAEGKTVFDTTYICARDNAKRVVRPAGLQEGITYNGDGSVTFCLYAPSKSNVYLLGDFNDYRPDNNYMMSYDYNTNPSLKYWWVTVSGLDPNKEYGFQYLVDGVIRVGDPYCEKIIDPWNDKWINEKYEIYPQLKSYPTSKTNDIVSVFQINKPKYAWKSSKFVAPESEQLIIYEMLLRDFTTQGSLRAAMDKLDYLSYMGVNAIQLMPIQEFSGNDSWGYNPTFFFASDKAYGTENDYKAFIDACHSRGMAVILDVVFNHAWGDHPWCKLWWDGANNRPASNNPFFNPVAPHPYSVGNDFNHSNISVREYFKRVLRFWLTEYKIDGFRFDLTKGFTQNESTESTASNYDASRIGYLKEYNDAIKETNSKAYTILEHFCAQNEEKELADNGMMLWRNANHQYSQTAMGYSSESDFNQLHTLSSNMPAGSLVGFMESHDEERNQFKAKQYGMADIKTNLPTRMSRAATNAALFFTVPGPKMIWQFGELGYDISIDENGRTGRKPILWNYYDEEARRELYEVYSKLIALRVKTPELFAIQNSFSWQVGVNNWDNGRFLTIKSTDNSKNAVVAGNFTSVNKTFTVTFPHTGTWYNLMDGSTLQVTAANQSIAIDAHQFRLYTDFDAPTSDIDAPTEKTKVIISPNPVVSTLNVTAPCPINSIAVFSLSGRLLAKATHVSQIDLSGLALGNYIVRVETVNEVINTKIVKQEE